MKQDDYILGEGSFAIVVGPFELSNVIETGLFEKNIIQYNNKLFYIIKIHKKEVKNYQKIINDQKLYTKLEKQSLHHSILLPLATTITKGYDIIKNFPFMEKILNKNGNYQLELETYGGISFEKIIYNKHNPLFNVSNFLKIWKCIPNILEDSFTILFNNHLIMTDIKIENMVLSPQYKLYLIDVDINPNKKTVSRVITPYITELPPQYFNKEWWHSSDKETKDRLLQKYMKHYKQYKKEKKIISTILDFIHNYKEPTVLITQQQVLPKDEEKFQRLFFVIYPLFIMVLSLFIYKCVKVNTVEEKKHVTNIISFCLDILQKRGHFSSTFSYKTFQEFIWKMRTI